MKKLLTLLLLTAVTTLALSAVEFNKTAEYTANTYSKFLVESDNNIYQITDLGLLKSSNNGMTWINLDLDLRLNEVTDFEVGSDGQLLIIYKDKVRVSENEGYNWLDITNELSGSVVTNLEVMASGMVLAATENGAFRWESNSSSWNKLNLNSDTNNDAILAIGEDGEGNVLVSGSSSGISISNDGGLTFSALDLGISVGGELSTITAIELDSKANVWLGDSEGGIMTLNKATLELEEVLSSEVIADAIVDIESNTSLGILVSTMNKGTFSSTDGQNFTKTQGSGNLVTNLEVTNDNKLLLLDENGLSLGESSSSVTKLDLTYDGSSVIVFSSEENNRIAITSNGTLSGNTEGYIRVGNSPDEEMVINDLKVMGNVSIAATSKGIFKLTNSTGVWAELVSSNETGIASDIDVSAEGRILVGTENGLLISEDITFNSYETVDFTGLLDLDRKVTSIDVASNGRISVTNENYLYTSDDEGETFDAIDIGITINLISSIKWDSQGNVYLGTKSDGIFKSSNNGLTFTKLTGAMDNENIINIETQGSKLFVQTDNALMVSGNAGATFENVTEELNISSVTSLELVSNNRIELLTDKGIFTSEDNGDTFTKEKLNINLGTMTDIASNSSGEFILATMNNGLFKSNDNGQTWFNLSTELEALTITSLEVDGSDDNKYYIGTNNGLMVTFNGGNSFQLFDDNQLSGENIISLKTTADSKIMVNFGEESKLGIINSNNDLNVLYIDGNNEGIITANALGSYISVSTGNGLFVSVDGGANFEEVEGEGSGTEISGILGFASTSSGLIIASENKIMLNSNDENTDITGNLGLNSIVRIETTSDGSLIVLGDSKLRVSQSSDLSLFADANGNIGSSNSVFNFDIKNDGSLLLSSIVRVRLFKLLDGLGYIFITLSANSPTLVGFSA
jgi:ligand-binding sensor domain-containing protein